MGRSHHFRQETAGGVVHRSRACGVADDADGRGDQARASTTLARPLPTPQFNFIQIGWGGPARRSRQASRNGPACRHGLTA